MPGNQATRTLNFRPTGMGNKQEKPGFSEAKTLKEKKNVVGLAEPPPNSYQGTQNRDGEGAQMYLQ